VVSGPNSQLIHNGIEVEVEVTFRLTVSWPASLDVGFTSGTHNQILFFFYIDNCWFLDVERPLWREAGSVIYSYNCFWALPEQSLSGPSPAELTSISYWLIWDSSYLEDKVTVFISPRDRVAQLYPRALGFRKSRLKPLYNWRSVNQYVLASGTSLGPMTKFYFFVSFAGKLFSSSSRGALSD
jgi:hypothetical protein